MANIKSSAKRDEKSKQLRAKNRAEKTELKTMMKKFDAAVADGELPDGCEMVERFEPPMMTGTTVRVQTQKVVEALGNNLGAAAAALLTGEVE